ncbi:MAG: TlpA family protein disulfide reductase [Acidimicrobiia bacterium]|nr:TlpA family protein disulfide reductase [Acidimicrobiia bacterium]
MNEQKPPSPSTDDSLDRRRIPPVALLVAAFLQILLVLFLVTGVLGDDSAPAGEPAPSTEFALVDGGTTNLTELRGKPVVLNFFASWCAPCVRELPDLQSAFEEHGDAVEFMGLSVNDRESDTIALLDRSGITYTIGIDPLDDSIHRATSQIGVMPTTVFISADGSIVAVNPGIISSDDLERTITEVLLTTSERGAGG